MNKSLNKFKELLKNDLDDAIEISSIPIPKKDYILFRMTDNEDYIDRNKVMDLARKRTIYRFIYYMNFPTKEVKAFYFDYDINHLIYAGYNLSYKEQFEITMEFIKYNIEQGVIDINKNSEIINYRKILVDPHAGNIHGFNLEEKTYSGEVFKLIESDDKNLTEEELKDKEAVEAYMKEGSATYDEISLKIECHKKLKEHYFDKSEYTEEDIKIIINCLDKIGIPKEMLPVYEVILSKKIVKKTVNEKVTLLKKEETYSNDYYYSILNSLYDFKNSMPRKYIYPNEMKTIAFAMKKLRYNNEEIMNLLRDIELKNNSFECEQTMKYTEFLEKLEFYKEKCALESYIENIKSYIDELSKCSKDEFSFWVEAIEQEIKKAMYYIPKNYEYELQPTKK